MTLRDALRAALSGSLEDGWLYLAGTEEPRLDTGCIVITDGDHEAAARLGFPQEGLETTDILTTAAYAKSYENPVSDEMLLSSFVRYWR